MNRPPKTGIWRYANCFSSPPPQEHRVTLGEGTTPHVELPDLARDLGLARLVLKREDQNPTGSIKDRSLAYMVSHYKWKGTPFLTLSSSGNAAVAASAYAEKAGIGMAVFLSDKTPADKVERALRHHPKLILTPKPINFCNTVAKNYGVPNLRPSRNPLATPGYQTIAYEIREEFGEEIDRLFVFSTSASSLVGIGTGFGEIRGRGPALHCVQSGSAHSIVSHLYPEIRVENGEESGEVLTPTGVLTPAGFLAVQETARREEAVRLIRDSDGDAHYATAREVNESASLLESAGILTSPEGCAVLAAVRKSAHEIRGSRVLCILSGCPVREDTPVPSGAIRIDSYVELKHWADRIFQLAGRR